MDLAFLAKRYDRVGGTEIDLYELTQRLAAIGHKVHIYCGQIRTEPAAGVSLHTIPVRGPGRTALLKSVAVVAPKMARAGKHDLLYSFARTVDQDVIRCGGGLHSRFLQAMEETQSAVGRLFRKFDPYHRSMLKIEAAQFAEGHFREITAISQVVKDEILDAYPVPEDRIRIIANGIDPEEFSATRLRPLRAPTRERLGIPDDAKVLLFVGNGFKRKGLDTLLRAAAQMTASKPGVLVVGSDPMSSAYEATAKKLGIQERTIFVGAQQDASPYYAAADLFVLPSVQEAFGNVVLEALAAGVVPIVSSKAGASEVLRGVLRGGILENPSSPEELAATASKILEDLVPLGLSAESIQQAKGYTFEENTKAIEAQCERLLREK